MSRYDAIVIGASIGGLAAAALLAKSGARVLVLEEKPAPPEPEGPLFALDPLLVKTLGLERHGLAFAHRDLGLTSWDDEAPSFTISRDRRATARALARVSPTDAQAWAPFQNALQGQARALRRWWGHPHRSGEAADRMWLPGARARLVRQSLMGAPDFLARHFESPRLIGLLTHEALLGGLAPSEPGSALALAWRAAQQVAGLDGAVATPKPGSLVAALRAASGAELRLGAKVCEVLVWRGAAMGVRLAEGETFDARVVLSSLSRHASESLAGLSRPPRHSAVGEAALTLTLRDGFVLPASLAGGRAVLAGTPQDYADAHEAARAGRLSPALPLMVMAESPHRLRLTTPLAPVSPPGGWGALTAPFAAAAIRHLSRHMPGLAEALTGVRLTPPRTRPRASLAQLLAPAAIRAATGIDRLYLCGEDAEPLPAVSGRAGRLAAYFAGQALR
jgi:phytoene dehydrogenase-like protein